MIDVGISADHAALPSVKRPEVRVLQRDDIVGALEDGWRDFKAAPMIGLSFGVLYTLGGWAIFAIATMTGFHYLAYPFATGFALIAPFTAAGLYEVSKKLERGEPITFAAIFGSIRSSGMQDLGWMGLILFFSLILWVDFAAFIYVAFFGIHVPSMEELVRVVLGTPLGVIFLVVGNLAGALIAFTIFTVTVISCPLLVDRDIDFVTAMSTSIEAVRTNPGQMLAWAAMVALWFAVAVVTLLAGLVVILPVLGHATWHLYRRAIVPAA
jgi:uncharacterized membrane protein